MNWDLIWSQILVQISNFSSLKNDFALKTNIKRGLKSEIWINVSGGSGIKRLNRSERRQIYGIKKVWAKSEIKLLEFATTVIIYHQKSESRVRIASLNKRFLGFRKGAIFFRLNSGFSAVEMNPDRDEQVWRSRRHPKDTSINVDSSVYMTKIPFGNASKFGN